MTSTAKRIGISIAFFAIALVAGSIAAHMVFAGNAFSSHSARVNELIVDGFGIAASLLAVVAAYLAYPLRVSVWVRAYLTFVIFFALAYGFEFFLGFLWFAADKFRPFGHRP